MEDLDNKEVKTSASARRASRSHVTMFVQNTLIFFMPMPRTYFKVEEFRLE